MSKPAPCPWCEDGGKPFLHKEHHPQFAFSVQCTSCGARGPHVKFTHDKLGGRLSYEELVAPVKEEALRLWNQRVQVNDEKSSEDAPDTVIAA